MISDLRKMLGWGAMTLLLAAPAFAGVDEAKELYEDDQFEETKAELEPVLKEDPDNKDALYYMGRASFDLGQHEEAEEYFSKLVEMEPDNSDYHLWVGRAIGLRARHSNMLVQGRLAPKIRDAFARSVELDPDNVDARMGLMQYYAEAPGFLGGDIEKAKAQAAEIAKLDSAMGESAYGNIHFEQEEWDLALARYEKAIEEGSEYGPTYANAGTIYAEKGDTDKAREMFNEALKHDPGNQEAKEGLKDL